MFGIYIILYYVFNILPNVRGQVTDNGKSYQQIFTTLIILVTFTDPSASAVPCNPYQATEYLPLTFDGSGLLTGSTLSGTLSGTYTEQTVIVGKGLGLGTTGQLGFTGLTRSTDCFHSPDQCPNGFTFNIIIYIDHTISATKYYVSNGGGNSGSLSGINLRWQSSNLVATLHTKTPNQQWEASISLSQTANYFISLTWDNINLKLYALYIDNSGTLVTSLSATATGTSQSYPPFDTYAAYYIGRDNQISSDHGDTNYDEVTFWEEVKSLTFLSSLATSQNSTRCVVTCSHGDSGYHGSCYACNFFWDCDTNTLHVCRHGYSFDSTAGSCQSTSNTCPDIVAAVGNDNYACFPSSCGSGPCANNGTCVELGDGWLCDCNAGWGGDQCETNIDQCDNCKRTNTVHCIGGIVGLNNLTCHCNAGYGTTTCHTVIVASVLTVIIVLLIIALLVSSYYNIVLKKRLDDTSGKPPQREEQGSVYYNTGAQVNGESVNTHGDNIHGIQNQ